MRIAFLNSCLEPGRDGVGDYTRLLAQECGQQGHECCTIALNDRYVLEPQSDSPAHLRLPSKFSWLERIEIAKRILTDFAPDWISLQFVPYAFHQKGLVHGLGRHLLPAVQGKNVQIMFHELWIGNAIESSFTHRIIGMAQRQLILGLVKQLTPAVVHTSNSAYVTLLERAGVTAFCLPLFGNIPVTNQDGDEWLWAELNKAGIRIAKANRSEFWMTGFFGTLHPNWPSEPLLTMLQDAAEQQCRQIILLSIGRLGPGEALWEGLVQKYSPSIRFCKLGERSASHISQYLSSLDFGVATSPYDLIGKSGSVAAMRDHGLPVIINRFDSQVTAASTDVPNDEGLLHRLDDNLVAEIADWKRLPPEPRLPRVAAEFAASLEKHSRGASVVS